jgi:hypothetical protein
LLGGGGRPSNLTDRSKKMRDAWSMSGGKPVGLKPANIDGDPVPVIN